MNIKIKIKASEVRHKMSRPAGLGVERHNVQINGIRIVLIVRVRRVLRFKTAHENIILFIKLDSFVVLTSK